MSSDTHGAHNTVSWVPLVNTDEAVFCRRSSDRRRWVGRTRNIAVVGGVEQSTPSGLDGDFDR